MTAGPRSCSARTPEPAGRTPKSDDGLSELRPPDPALRAVPDRAGKPAMEPALYDQLVAAYPPQELFEYIPKIGKKYSLSERNNPDKYRSFVDGSPLLARLPSLDQERGVHRRGGRRPEAAPCRSRRRPAAQGRRAAEEVAGQSRQGQARRRRARPQRAVRVLDAAGRRRLGDPAHRRAGQADHARGLDGQGGRVGPGAGRRHRGQPARRTTASPTTS